MIEKDGRLWLGPASKKQEDFLNSKCTITLGGGAAGGGKTYTSLLIALKFMQEPNTTGVIFRRTSKMLTAPGSVWHEAVSMYTALYGDNIRIRHRENEILFPNGINKGIAIAINQQVISKDRWSSYIINENDKVMIIKATQGG